MTRPGSDNPSEDRFDRAVRALVDSAAGPAWVAGLARAARRFPDAPGVRSSVAATQDALADQPGRLVTATLGSGSRVVVDPSDAEQRDLLFTGEIDPPTTRLLERIAWPGWRFVDVGSRAGYFALLALDLGGPNAVVRAFEADELVADALTESVRRAGADRRVLVVPAACGARKGMRYGPTGPVMEVSLDDHCEVHGLEPDVVRVEADGHQIEAVEGMRRLLARRVPRYVICPSGWRDDASAVHAFVTRFGYEALAVTGDGELQRGATTAADTVAFVAH